MQRRAFLQTASYSLLGLYMSPATILQASVPKPAGKRLLFLTGAQFGLLDLQTGLSKKISVPISKGHSVLVSPHLPEKALVIEQDGDKAALVSLTGIGDALVFQAEKGHWFSGHGAFSKDAKKLFLPEYSVSKKDVGWVSTFDLASGKRVNRFTSGAAQAHEVVPLANSDTLVVGHYGAVQAHGPNIGGDLVFLDSNTGRQLKRVKASDPSFSLCHIARDENDRLLVSTRAWFVKGKRPDGSLDEEHLPTPIYIVDGKGDEWSELRGDAYFPDFRLNLSVLIDGKTGLVGHLQKGLVSIWSMEQRQLKTVVKFPGQMIAGLACFDRYYLVSTIGGKLFYLDKDSLQTTKTVDLSLLGLKAGAHLTIC